MMKIILAITLTIIGVSCQDMCIHHMNPKSPTCPIGGPAIQILTPNSPYSVDGLYYDESNTLCYTDRAEATIYDINLETGKIEHLYINAPGIEGEQLAFVYPTQEETLKVIGAGCSILTAKYEESKGIFTYNAPIPVSKDKNYIICKAHADENGILFLTLNSKADKAHRGGQLYKIVNHIPMLVKQFKWDVGDFAWNENSTVMFLIGNYGKIIYKYDYNSQESTISNEQEFYKLPVTSEPDHHKITGLDIDNKGCLWVTVKIYGSIMEIDTKTGNVKQIIQMPNSELTGITIGGKEMNGLYVGTSKKCKNKEHGSGSIYYISGIYGEGKPDKAITW